MTPPTPFYLPRIIPISHKNDSLQRLTQGLFSAQHAQLQGQSGVSSIWYGHRFAAGSERSIIAVATPPCTNIKGDSLFRVSALAHLAGVGVAAPPYSAPRCGRTTITFISVISSIAYFIPSRPKPDCLTPPYGMLSTRKVGKSSTITPPTSASSNARNA